VEERSAVRRGPGEIGDDEKRHGADIH
jgi:hypothetical protein